MTIPTWEPPIPPSPSLPKTVNPRLLSSGFGDGYSAVAADGLHHMLLEPFEIQFLDIDLADANEMNDFMLARAGVERFLYVFPFETTPRKFRVTKFGIEHGRSDNNHNFRATLQEVP